tara:strand:+ start:150 stop:2258 length:2109 start_codon:yes stop_codon:yes gene_type:complete
MADKIYVVTLKKKDDLDGFYSDMESDGFKLQMKRPISRNTHYFMTDDQAATLRNDSRVLAVELRPEDIPYVEIGYDSVDVDKINNIPHGHGPQFRKDGTFGPDDRDWGKLHVAGTDVQRRKGSWGGGTVTDNADIFNNGRHVDVVVCDAPVSFDCEEWKALSDNRDRFQMYDWYLELNSYVTSIDDDGTSLPGGNYSNYFTNASNTTYHGTHVCGTIAGKFYGWAPEANIYSMQVLGNAANQGTAVPTLLIFDYLRAFHRYKEINPETGYRNPTVTNHSWGWSSPLANLFDGGINISQVVNIVYRGTTYSSGNPNPSGWTMNGIERDFGIGPYKRKFNYHYAAINADVEDAIEDGVVVIGAAGNNDYYSPSSEPTDPSYVDWNNSVYLDNGAGFQTLLYYQRGSSPCNAKGVINVGAMDHESDFRRASFSNFGPRVDVWAPGVEIVSCYNNYGTADSKYGGSNYYEAIQGTSMASPQVCGVAACIATGKTRFTNSDVKAYIQQHGKYGDMSWDTQGGDFTDTTCRGLNAGLYFDGDAPELRCVKTRDTGHLAGWYKDQLKGHRRHKEVIKRGQVQLYPRVNQYYRKQPWDIMKIVLTVTTPGGNYHFTGTDRVTTHNNSEGPDINMNVGDILTIQCNNTGQSHPIYLRHTPGSMVQNTVNNPPATGNGAVGNTSLEWIPSAAGTYYYQCFNHNSMIGNIIVT